MGEEIKDLIEKINQEGIQAAQAKAQEIEELAKLKADEILVRARKEAEKLISDAKENLARMEKKEKSLLAQAGRDLLLAARSEISAMLQRMVALDVRETLTPETIGKILVELIKHYGGQQKADVVISLKKEDADILERAFLGKLKEETKKGITLKPSEEISGGFTISFDAGKSQFDFTDNALAEYIGLYLKPKLNAILKDAVSGLK